MSSFQLCYIFIHSFQLGKPSVLRLDYEWEEERCKSKMKKEEDEGKVSVEEQHNDEEEGHVVLVTNILHKLLCLLQMHNNTVSTPSRYGYDGTPKGLLFTTPPTRTKVGQSLMFLYGIIV